MGVVEGLFGVALAARAGLGGGRPRSTKAGEGERERIFLGSCFAILQQSKLERERNC